MTNKTDSELVALARCGDKEAFDELIERYQQMVRRIALGMVAHEEVARDLAQEAILQAYLSLDHLRDSTRFKSWLYGIVLNVCRGYIRDQKTDPFSLEAMMGGMYRDMPFFPSGVIDPEEVAEQRELHRIVLNAIQQLSPKDRLATLLFYYEQLSLREIAAILGVSISAVKGRLYRAREQLRERLLPVYADTTAARRNIEPGDRTYSCLDQCIEVAMGSIIPTTAVTVLCGQGSSGTVESNSMSTLKPVEQAL